MIISRKCIFAILLFVLAAVSSIEYAYGGPVKPPKWKVRQREQNRRQEIIEDKIRTQRHKNTHDLNNDGIVDAKDRLIWLNNRGGNYDKVYISTENEDITEAMDANGDGNVEAWEMKEFMENYDLNNDGVLDEYEIGQAVD